MSGVSTALSSTASHAQKAAPSIGDCVHRPSSISRLWLTRLQHPGLRLRGHTPISSACFRAGRTSSDLKFDNLRNPFRKLRLSPAASSDELASVSENCNESENSNEALNKSASDISDFANHKQETNAKAPTGTGENVETEENSEFSNKFIGVLRDTTEELKEQAEKARAALVVTAQETAASLAATAQQTAEKSKENLSYITENAPDPIREIADTAIKAHSADTPKQFSKIHDFCLGIPYGTSLVICGLVWFIISGSTASIRFGVILGGILLGLSVSSLNAWKQGDPTGAYIKGQAAISSILALREIRRLFECWNARLLLLCPPSRRQSTKEDKACTCNLVGGTKRVRAYLWRVFTHSGNWRQSAKEDHLQHGDTKRIRTQF